MVFEKQKNPENSHNRDNSNVGVGEDKISDLSEPLIHHILSFLPIKCAMSTCILSKRWKYVVNSIPILNFLYCRTLKGTKKQNLLETKCFMNFLDTVLFLHEKPNIHTNIQKFSLYLDEFFNESRINRWISTIIKRRVEEFCLYIDRSSTSSIFPLSFFTCDSLTLLGLNSNVTTRGKFSIPDTVYFSKLKIFRLRNLSLVDEGSTRKLFSNCPILEELSLYWCWVSEGLCIANPALKHLSITSGILSKPTVMKISAPNLLTISYTGHTPADFVLNSFPSLVEAYVHFYIVEEFENPNNIFVKLFEKLSRAKLLKVSIYAGSSLDLSEADILSTDLPAFNNLINLEVGTRSSSGSNSVSSMRKNFRFLQLSPNLESIVIPQTIHIPEEEEDGGWLLDPKSSLRHLKSVKFKKFCGEPKEVNAIKLFLKHARFLQTVTIVASSWLSKDHEKQVNVMKDLLMFPKPVDCVVKFLTTSEEDS